MKNHLFSVPGFGVVKGKSKKCATVPTLHHKQSVVRIKPSNVGLNECRRQTSYEKPQA